MVEHTRSSTGSGSGASQPITRHPLFPAIVALWFGALFGLGSLALRPALVEHLVIASGIDAIVPMAAPPLGTTMRILVALALTGLGGIIGFVVARRLAAPATAPAPAAVTGTSRRRSLSASATGSAVLNDTPATTILDPVILDVADLDPDGLDGPAIAPAPASARAREMAFGTFVTPTPTPTSTPAKAVEAAKEPASLETRLFDSYARDLPTRADTSADTATDAPANAGAEPEPGFTLLAPITESTTDEPIEPATLEAEAPSPVPVEAAAFIMAEPVRDPAPFVVPFAAPMAMAMAMPVPVPVPVSQPESRLAVSRLVNAPLDELSPVELLERLALAMARRREEDARLALAEAEAEAEAETLAAAAVAAQIAEAEAQARAEQARAEAAVTIATPLADDPAPVAELPVMQEPVEETVAVEPAAFTPPPPVKFERLSLRAVQFEAPTQSVAVEQPETEYVVAESAPAHEAPFATAEGDEAQSVAETVAESIEEAAPELAEPAPFAMPRVPRALRPVDPFAFQDDDDALPGYIPPRHIGRAAPFASPDAFVSPAAFASEAPAVEETEVEEAEDHSIYALDEPEAEPDAEEEGETLDTGYSSLLSLSRPAAPRQSFIRIDEPEETGETPPMVVFPGNEPEAAPAAEAAHGLASIPSTGPRLFDGPARADADGTERALRAALATLQRMSGAA